MPHPSDDHWGLNEAGLALCDCIQAADENRRRSGALRLVELLGESDAFALAVDNDVQSHVAHALGAAASEDWKRAHEKVESRMSDLMRELDSVADMLAAAGIPVVALKNAGIARGLYDNPKTHPKLGILAPTPEQIVAAIKTKQHTKTQPTGAYAANLLGLSTQVPGKVVFLTDGPSKQLKVGNRTIQLKSRSTRTMAGAGQITGLFIQALKHIGQKRFTKQHFKILNERLEPGQKKKLKRSIKLAPAWIAAIIHKLN